MAFLSWRKDYKVGVEQIDSEHHSLFDLINGFHETCMQDDGQKEIPKLLNKLVAYAEEHFQHEEKLMSENDYPLLDKHREQHSELVTSIFEINERITYDPIKTSGETLQFVRKWLINHILKDDMDIADFLKQKTKQKSRTDQLNSTDQDKPGG